MAPSSPRFKQDDSQQSSHRIISVEVDQKLTSVLVARVASQWFYVDVRLSDLKDKSLRQKYYDAAQKVVDEQNAGDEGGTGGSTNQPRSTASSKVSPGSQKTGDARPSLSAAESELAALLLPAFESRFETAARADEKASKGKAERPTLMQWYKAPIACLSVSARSGSKDFTSSDRSDLDGDAYVRNGITPHMPLPKPLRELPGVPWYSPSELEVCAESHDIHMPLHPTIVQLRNSAASPQDKTRRANGDGKQTDAPQYFLKLATRDDAPSVERELRILSTLQKRDMYMDDGDDTSNGTDSKENNGTNAKKTNDTHKPNGTSKNGTTKPSNNKVRAPRLAGLVALPSSPTSHSSILGFLLTLIPQPSKPLLTYMDSDVSRTRRDAWATEASRTIRALHDAGIIWGDAKGDNFLVDKHDQLWIIDFGGSYTPGWVDEKKAGTREGDRQGLGKIVNGARDPDRFLEEQIEEENEVKQSEPEQKENGEGRKRSRKEDMGSVKRRKRT